MKFVAPLVLLSLWLAPVLAADASGGFLQSMTDWRMIKSNSFPDMCWAMPPGVTKIALFPCKNLDPTTDIMAFKYDSATQQIKIMDGRCLQLVNPAPGFMLLQLKACSGGQEFKFTEDAEGKVHSAANGGGLCLNVDQATVDFNIRGVSRSHLPWFIPCDAAQGHSLSSAPAPPLVKARAEAIENGKPDPKANAVIATTLPATKAPTDSPTGSPTTPTPITLGASSPVGSASGDPHFRSFGGGKFDFHGGCDLVLLQNPNFANGLGLSVHIRTKIETWWSYIEVVVVQVGDQLLELMGGPVGEGPKYWVNGVAGEENVEEDQNLKALLKALKSQLNGFSMTYKKVSPKQHKFRINLNRAGDAISLQTYKDWVSMNVKASSAKNFQRAKGLMGEYPSGAKVSRNGKEITDPVAFGKEWQVLDTEPMLFHETKGVQHPKECAMPSFEASAGRKKRRLGEALITEEAAAMACAHADEDNKDGCVFDVLATNDMDMAGAY